MTEDATSADASSSLQIVVDSSVLRRTGGNLAFGDWPVLQAAARLGWLRLRLPTTVLQELVDHRRRDLLQLIDMERKVARQRDRLIGNHGSGAPQLSRAAPVSEAHVDRLCDEYASEVTEWFMSVGSVLGDPRVKHHELVARLLSRKRPFTESERGYRDALIWYSALECAADGPTILLTANTKDFAKEEHGTFVLADELVADLEARGLPRDRVKLLTATPAVLREVLPNWDDSALQSAWMMHLASDAGVRSLDNLVDAQLGVEFTTSPPDAPPWLWAVGIRSVEAVTSVEDVHVVPDSDGWYRVHSAVICNGRIGGYAWSWGDPDADLGDFALCDDWGGLTEYFASDSVRCARVVVAARFRPLVEVEELNIVRARLIDVSERDGVLDDLSRVNRSLRALLVTLSLHGDRPEFLADIFGDSGYEFEMVVGTVVAEWQDVADAVPGRYSTLTLDNLASILRDAAGLRALRQDLESATSAVNAILEVQL